MPSYEEVTQRAGSLLAMTGFTATELHALLPHFEQALLVYMGNRTMDGQPRTSRRYSPYANCPLPTPADKRLFILSYVKHNPMQELQGHLCGMSQANANKWIHLLHAVLNHAVAAQDLLPARTADELAARLARHKADPVAPSPLVSTMGPNVRSNGRRILQRRKNTPAARRSGTRSKTSC